MLAVLLTGAVAAPWPSDDTSLKQATTCEGKFGDDLDECCHDCPVGVTCDFEACKQLVGQSTTLRAVSCFGLFGDDLDECCHDCPVSCFGLFGDDLDECC